jgi:hypothetical protein
MSSIVFNPSLYGVFGVLSLIVSAVSAMYIVFVQNGGVSDKVKQSKGMIENIKTAYIILGVSLSVLFLSIVIFSIIKYRANLPEKVP